MKPDELARLRAKAAAAMAVSDDGHWFKAESLDMDPADADYVSALPPGKVVDMIDHIAKLEGALRIIANVDQGGGFMGALACRQVARAALGEGV